MQKTEKYTEVIDKIQETSDLAAITTSMRMKRKEAINKTGGYEFFTEDEVNGEINALDQAITTNTRKLQEYMKELANDIAGIDDADGLDYITERVMSDNSESDKSYDKN